MQRISRLRSWLGLLVTAGLSVTCSSEQATSPPESAVVHQPTASVSGASATAAAASEVLVGAGDVASCSTNRDELTAQLLDGIAGQVFTAGDNAFPNGSATDYTNCYQPTWGRHKARTRPAAGDRDYRTSGAAGYFGYFGAAAGNPATGYYSYDLGDWHIVVLNTALSTSATSAQVRWLRDDLAANGRACTMAIWHRPYVTSSTVGGRPAVRPLWDALYEYGADVIVNAHARVYERFAPQNPSLAADPVNGIRQFVVGTGGRGTDGFGTIQPNSEVRNSGTSGVIKFTLHAGGYDWQFVPVAGQTFTDAGSATCSGSADPDAPPVADAGGPYTADGPVTFDGSASSDPQGDLPLTYDWDFGDGTAHGTGAAPTHGYAADGQYTVTLVVTDADGNASAPATTTATVANVAPTVAVAATGATIPGSPVPVRVTFSDPGTNDAPWTYRVTWGDGSAATTGTVNAQSPIDLAHTYAAAGNYTVTATVTDKDGGVGTGTVALAVFASSAEPHILIGAGDIAECGSDYWNKYDEETGKLIDAYPDATVFTAGDNAYPVGSAADYQNCYEPAWGRFKSRTWAALGNHEYDTGDADATFDYFGDRAGPRDKGYYAVELGDWQLIVLNDNDDWVPFAAGSAQDLWLQNVLATSTKQCTIVIWHQPLTWSHDDGPQYRASRKIFWDRLYAAGVEVVVHGHQHFYERFAPMNPDRVRDDANGIRQFIVGTGGSGVRAPSVQNAPNSEVLGVTKGAGVIKFTLRDGGYDWEFLPIAGQTFTDSGSDTCH